jgi:hypothetical protein
MTEILVASVALAASTLAAHADVEMVCEHPTSDRQVR